MIVMMMAMTPSLNASSRLCPSRLLPAAGNFLRVDRVGERQAVVVGDVADLQVVAVRRGGVIALERRGVDFIRRPTVPSASL